MDQVVQLVEPQMKLRDITYAASIPNDLAVRADPEKLQQVLLNLLSKATKFTPRGGRVEGRANRRPGDPGQVAIHVSDTGKGIPSDRLENIFDRFVQVDLSPTRSEEGSGLGLAISRDLVHGMGGTIAVGKA